MRFWRHSQGCDQFRLCTFFFSYFLSTRFSFHSSLGSSLFISKLISRRRWFKSPRWDFNICCWMIWKSFGAKWSISIQNEYIEYEWIFELICSIDFITVDLCEPYFCGANKNRIVILCHTSISTHAWIFWAQKEFIFILFFLRFFIHSNV